MKKLSSGFVIAGFIIMAAICAAVILIYTYTMADKSRLAINEIGNIYMEGLSDNITAHFQTTFDLQLNKLDTIASSCPPDMERDMLIESLRREGMLREFDSLAFLSDDGEMQMIYGEQVMLTDMKPFLDSLNNDERKAAFAVNSAGDSYIALGISTVYPMNGGKNCTALVASISDDYAEKMLAFDEINAITYSSVIRTDGEFVVKNYKEASGNYFERLRTVYSPSNPIPVDTLIAEIKDVMSRRDTYTAVFRAENERRHIYCTPLSSSEWYLITVMPAGRLDGIIDGLNDERTRLLIMSLIVTSASFMVIFVLYFRRTRAQIDALEKANEKALRASKAKSEFLSNMSHDIRTPMNAIVGMTAIAADNIDNKQQLKNCLKKIDQSNKQLLGLINNILDISKIESGKMTLNIENVSLRDITDNIVTIFQPSITEKNQKFDVMIYNIITENICGDGVRLNQVVMNLMSNAVKYTQDGGTIQLSIYQEESLVGDNYVRLHLDVKDNGIGMSEDFQKVIFQSFTRGDSKRIQKAQGSGLGMAITKYIVDAMEGTIDIKSAPGEGTLFRVTVDVEKAVENEQDMTLPPWDILVVDNDEMLLEGAAASLRKLGVKPVCASGGEAAVEAVKERIASGGSYDYILMDRKMPVMNGIEASREINSITNGSIPIIMISVYDWNDIEEEALGAGIVGIIPKPLFTSTLYYGLKRISETASGEESGEESSVSDFEGVRILVAEDNDINWEIVDDLLSELGFELDHAEDGKVCVDMFSASEPWYYSAILMDIRMPIMNGYDATEAIRRMKNRPDSDIPIIAMTADAFSEDIKKCLDCGMNAHTAKPIDVDKIVHLLEKHIKKHDKEHAVKG